MAPVWKILALLLCLFPPASASRERIVLKNNDNYIAKRVTAGVTVRFSFQVTRGLLQHVSTKIRSPSSKVLYSVEHKRYGRFSFVAEEDGYYMFCFRNELARLPKTVVYTIDIGTEQHPEGEDFFDASEREETIREAIASLRNLKASINQTVNNFEERIGELEKKIVR